MEGDQSFFFSKKKNWFGLFSFWNPDIKMIEYLIRSTQFLKPEYRRWPNILFCRPNFWNPMQYVVWWCKKREIILKFRSIYVWTKPLIRFLLFLEKKTIALFTEKMIFFSKNKKNAPQLYTICFRLFVSHLLAYLSASLTMRLMLTLDMMLRYDCLIHIFFFFPAFPDPLCHVGLKKYKMS